MTAFLALLIAHVLADFVFQRSSVIAGKQRCHWLAWAEHGAVHLICLLGSWLLFSPLPLLEYKVGIAFALIVATHLLADWIKVRHGSAYPWAALGLVLAAKSVFRFEDIKKGRRHAEYFLIGTLISVVEVVLVGMLVLVITSLTGEMR